MKNNKKLGQHWLKDRIILDDIANLSIDSNNNATTCLEIGPGLGTLTSSLLRNFKKVIAIEFDKKLAKNLPNSFPGKNLIVINADFLKFDLSSIKEPYIAAGNIPYYITSPIIEKLLIAKNKPKKITLLVQKEVADRIASKDGTESVLSLFCQNYAKITAGPIITKNYFTPPPKVDSEIIIFEPYKKPLYDKKVFELIKIGFSSPRKKLVKNLLNIKSFTREKITKCMEDLNININSRPADLKLGEWVKLAEWLKLS